MTAEAADVLILDLTGPNSHTIRREPGQGSFAIGPADMPVAKLDAVVPADASIAWTAFDGLTVPAGYPWPRAIYYQGGDTGFAAWSRKRPIERFVWYPAASALLDLTGARIGELSIELTQTAIELTLGATASLVLRGDLSLLHVRAGGPESVPRLQLRPKPPPTPGPFGLPNLRPLSAATDVGIEVDVMGPPFDCGSLLQFAGLRCLSLQGSMTGLHHLAGLGLEQLELRLCRDLSGLPDLEAWPELTSLIGFNVEAEGGRRLQQHLKRIARSGRRMTMARIVHLREPNWFAIEAELPFAAWPPRSARIAVKAFRKAAVAVNEASSIEAMQDAVARFVGSINALPGIATSEREDVAVAVERLADLGHGLAPRDLVMAWFDQARDF